MMDLSVARQSTLGTGTLVPLNAVSTCTTKIVTGVSGQLSHVSHGIPAGYPQHSAQW